MFITGQRQDLKLLLFVHATMNHQTTQSTPIQVGVKTRNWETVLVSSMIKLDTTKCLILSRSLHRIKVCDILDHIRNTAAADRKI
jgi:hypothetical protein